MQLEEFPYISYFNREVCIFMLTTAKNAVQQQNRYVYKIYLLVCLFVYLYGENIKRNSNNSTFFFYCPLNCVGPIQSTTAAVVLLCQSQSVSEDTVRVEHGLCLFVSINPHVYMMMMSAHTYKCYLKT